MILRARKVSGFFGKRASDPLALCIFQFPWQLLFVAFLFSSRGALREDLKLAAAGKVSFICVHIICSSLVTDDWFNTWNV